MQRLKDVAREHQELTLKLEEEVAVTARSRDAACTDLAAVEAAHAAVCAENERRYQDVQAEAVALRSECGALQQRLSSLQGSASDAQRNMEDLRSQVAGSDTAQDVLQRELVCARAAHDAVCAKLAALQATHEVDASRADEISAQGAAVAEAQEAQMAALQQELAGAQADLGALERNFADMSAKWEQEAVDLQTEAQQAAQVCPTVPLQRLHGFFSCVRSAPRLWRSSTLCLCRVHRLSKPFCKHAEPRRQQPRRAPRCYARKRPRCTRN